MYSALDQFGNANALQGPAPSHFDPNFGSAYSDRTQIRAGKHGGLAGGARRVPLNSAHSMNRLMFDPSSWFDADRGSLTTQKTGSIKVPYTGEVIETYENRLLPGTTDRYSHSERTLGRAGSHLRMQRRVIQRRDAKVSTYRPSPMRGSGRITESETMPADRNMARKATRYLKTSISASGDHETPGPAKISDRSGAALGGYDYRRPFDPNAPRVYDPKLFISKRGGTDISRAPQVVLEPKGGFNQGPTVDQLKRNAPVRRRAGKALAPSRIAYGDSDSVSRYQNSLYSAPSHVKRETTRSRRGKNSSGITRRAYGSTGQGNRYQKSSISTSKKSFDQNVSSRRGTGFMEGFMRTKNVSFVECAYVSQPPPTFQTNARKFSVDPSLRSSIATESLNVPIDPRAIEFNKKTKAQRPSGSAQNPSEVSMNRTLQLVNIARSALSTESAVEAARDAEPRSSRGGEESTRSGDYLQGGGMVGVTVARVDIPEQHESASRRGEAPRPESEFKSSGAPINMEGSGDAPIPGDRPVQVQETTTSRGTDDSVILRQSNVETSDGTAGSCRIESSVEESVSSRGTDAGVGLGSAALISVPSLSVPAGKAGVNESALNQVSDSISGRIRTKREMVLPKPLTMGIESVRGRSGKLPSISETARSTDRESPSNVTEDSVTHSNGAM